MKTISVNLEIPIYKTVLNVLVADSVKQAMKWMRVYDEYPKEFDDSNACFHISKKGHWILAFRQDKLTPGTIAHECFHAVCGIMRSKGVYFCEESEEAYAYLLDYLISEINSICSEDGIDIHAK